MTDTTPQTRPQFLTGLAMGRLLCEAFGLPPERIRRITLCNPIGDVATLEVERILTDDEGRAIKALLQHYRLVPTGKATDVALDVQAAPDGTLFTDTTTVAEPGYRYAAVAPQALIRDVTRNDAPEREYLTIDPAAGRSQ